MSIGQGRSHVNVSDNSSANMNDEVVILEEDIHHEPSRQDIIDYALYLGMELPRDEHLLWIATEGLKAPLPPRWKAVKYKKDNEEDHYYFNFKTGESQWEHPCDQFYKDLYAKEKEKQSKTAQIAVTALSSIATSTIIEPSRQSSTAPLQTIPKDRLVLGKLPKMERKLESLKKMPPQPSLSLASSINKEKLQVPGDQRQAFDEWAVKEKERIETERQEWTQKRQEESETWMQARVAEMEARRQRQILELRHKVETELAQLQQDYEKRVQEQRQQLQKDQLKHEMEMESRRSEWVEAIKEGTAKKEAMLKQKITELQQEHQNELIRMESDMKAKTQSLEQEKEEIVKIQANAIEARKAELNIKLEHIEIESKEREKRARQDLEKRLLQIEREGRENCKELEQRWIAEYENTEQNIHSTSTELKNELEKSKKIIVHLETKISKLQSNDNERIKTLEHKLEIAKEENARLKDQISNSESRSCDNSTRLRELELEKLLQEATSANTKIQQENKDLSKRLADNMMQTTQQTQRKKPERNVNDPIESHPEDSLSEGEGENANATLNDLDIEQVFETELSDVSDMSDAGFEGNVTKIHSKWSSQLQREQAAIDRARHYLMQEKKMLARAKVSILKSQEKWKRDRQQAQTSHIGSLPVSAERTLRKRKQMLDLQTRRLNSDISQYQKLKRGLERRQSGLYCLQRDATITSNPMDSMLKVNPDPTNDGKSLELAKQWTTPTSRSPANDAKATLHSHAEWLKSFRSDVMRKVTSASDLPGATQRYHLQKSAPIRPQTGLAIPQQSTSNDITIRIKVEK